MPETFAYTEPADPSYPRALLEMTGILSVGFLWYVTQTDIAQDYDVNYTWPVFRKKLTGEALGFDTNHFGTNFIGHPLGGTGYYLAARSNRLSIAESLGFAVFGSLLWEYFGEVSERVSATTSDASQLRVNHQVAPTTSRKASTHRIGSQTLRLRSPASRPCGLGGGGSLGGGRDNAQAPGGTLTRDPSHQSTVHSAAKTATTNSSATIMPASSSPAAPIR